MNWNSFIQQALDEDVREGDYTSLACISEKANGSARLLIKDSGILAGVELAEKIFFQLSPEIQFTKILSDGTQMQPGQIAFELLGRCSAACPLTQTASPSPPR